MSYSVKLCGRKELIQGGSMLLWKLPSVCCSTRLWFYPKLLFLWSCSGVELRSLLPCKAPTQTQPPCYKPTPKLELHSPVKTAQVLFCTCDSVRMHWADATMILFLNSAHMHKHSLCFESGDLYKIKVMTSLVKVSELLIQYFSYSIIFTAS